MRKPVIGLPISHHFNTIFPELTDIVGVIIVRDVQLLPSNLVRDSHRKAYHTNGLVNIQFAEEMTDEFINILNSYTIYHMSFDCGPSCLDVYIEPKNGYYLPNNPSIALKPKEIIKIAKERIKFIKSRFRGTIALENLDYHRGGAYEHVCNPDFITEMLRELDVSFAVDIAHVLVTSYNLGIEPFKYIKRLPLDRISEVHLSHSEAGNDKHDCPTSYEYDFLNYILVHSAPEFVVLEYYQNPQKIIEENTKLSRFLNI